ncbi:MAG TPA: hypothetical protein VEX60_04185, partial [Pyrinomonadaceae bacterium]|nr:hypothetical protein [Pyrinomonadaceae bacterium]
RLNFFEQSLAGTERVREFERAIAERSASEGDAPYVRGDVFFSEDHAHYLIFGDGLDGGAGLRAGIVYDAGTSEPEQGLDDFCRIVREILEAAARNAGATGAQDDPNGASAARIEWRPREGHAREVFKSFAGEASSDAFAAQPRVGSAAERVRAGEILEDAGARGLLQRLSEAHADGRAAGMLASGGREPEQEALVARLAGAGLVRREVQISCRKDGHSLFRLPSPEALAMVTASNAVCSECGAAVADERAEELVTPTPLAKTILSDGAWLVNSLRSTLLELGIPEREIAVRQPSGEGEAQMLANVCGEPFLFALRDGDFTAAHTRRLLDGEAETHASHIVVVATGKIQDEARVRLRDHARRRSRAGGEQEVVFVEGLNAAGEELRRAFERVSQDALTRELYELDASVGFNVGYALAARFRLMQRKGELQDLAASAAGAVAGSLREI